MTLAQIRHGERGARPDAEDRFFTVVVAGESFGLPVESVQTIFQIEVVTPVPLGPREILGLVNLRGKVVTAVSLRRRLGMPDLGAARGALAVGIEHRSEAFALVVDEVGDVILLGRDAQIATPPHLDGERMKLTSAVYRLEKGILPILKMSALFELVRKV